MKRLFALLMCAFFVYANEFDEFESDFIKDEIYDPFYTYNHAMHQVNKALFNMSIRPMSAAYDALMLPVFKKGVGNFFDNLGAPLRAISLLFSGEGKAAASEFGSFIMNSIAGVGGLIKIAPGANKDSDFGLAAARWGIKPGAHLELPILGPSNVRDALFMPLNFLAHPASYLAPLDSLAFKAIDLTQQAAKNKALINQGAASINSYVVARDWYEKSRKDNE